MIKSYFSTFKSLIFCWDANFFSSRKGWSDHLSSFCCHINNVSTADAKNLLKAPEPEIPAEVNLVEETGKILWYQAATWFLKIATTCYIFVWSHQIASFHCPACDFFSLLFLSSWLPFSVLVKRQRRCSLKIQLVVWSPINKQSLVQKWWVCEKESGLRGRWKNDHWKYPTSN